MRLLLPALLFLISLSANAGEWWQVGDSKGTTALHAAQLQCAINSFCIEACSEIPDTANRTYVRYDSTGGNNTCTEYGAYPGDTSFTALRYTGTCPANIPYQWSDNTCRTTEEPPPCPNAGTPTTYWVDTYAGQTYLTTFMSKNDCSVYGTSLTDTGCRPYSPPKLAGNGSEIFACLMNGEYSGATASSTPEEEPEVTDDSSDKSEQTDNRTSTENTSTSENLITDNGDGTSTEQQTSTTTKTEGEGTVIWEANGNIYIQDSTGNVTVTTQQTLIERAADNSYTETITETTTYTTADKTTQVINKSTGGSTTQSTPSKTTSQQKVTSNTYGTTGEQTSSSTTTTGGLDASEGTGDCPPNTECGSGDSVAGQPDFEVPTESWWESDYQDGLSGIWESKQQALSQTAFTEWLDGWSFASSGTSPVWAISMDTGIVNFGTFNLQVPDFVWSFIGICMIITALFTARWLLFGG